MKPRQILRSLTGRQPSTSARPHHPRLEQLEARIELASYVTATVPELIGAINASNLSAEADTITLSAPQFDLTPPVNYENGTSVLPAIKGMLSIEGQGARISLVSSESDLRIRLFNIASGATATLKDLTLSGGTGYGFNGAIAGGAVLNEGDLTMENVTLRDNSIQGAKSSWIPYGGPAHGGAIYSIGTLRMTNCLVTNNSSIGGDGAVGDKGIEPGSYVPPGTPAGSGFGGGVFIAGGTATLSDCTVTSNTAQGGKGGPGTDPNHYGLKPSKGGAGGNGYGGGIFVSAGSVVLNRVTITGNRAFAGEGGDAAKPNLVGKDGVGKGGGLFIQEVALVWLDAKTKKQTKDNTATTSRPNISGSYTLLS